MAEDKEKRNYGKTNRNLGHGAERLYATRFRELGYPLCITSRQGSRLHDDAGIDLMYIPFNVQIKAGMQRGLNAANELKNIELKVAEKFPEGYPEHSNPNILIHRKVAKKGVKRSKYDDLVTMAFEDYAKLIKKEG